MRRATGVAIELARLLRTTGEDPVAVSADALQVYVGLETLTGAATAAERAQLEHRLISFLPVDARFLGRFIGLYVSLILLFANAYFLFVVLDDDGSVPFAGIKRVWTPLGGPAGRTIRPGDAFESFVDCFHFSCVTMSWREYTSTSRPFTATPSSSSARSLPLCRSFAAVTL